ncbi:MAG: hypothetical protein N2037_11680 [Acidimicrobiales bacterium]|nr:hypothetical protein [Acidimicrobiales bacterium]
MVFGEPTGSPTSGQNEPEPDEVLLIRRTTGQWLVGALGRALSAFPLVLAAPFLPEDRRAVLLLTAGLAALTVAVLDLIVRYDAHVEVSRDGLLGDFGFVPWWAVDELQIKSWCGRRRITMRSFGSIVSDLVAPRTGPLVRNRHFDDDTRLLMHAWKAGVRHRGARLSRGGEEAVIDLRPSLSTEQQDSGERPPAEGRGPAR